MKKTTKKMATGGMLADAAGRAQRIAAAFGKKAAPAPAPKAAPAPAPKDNFVQKAQPAVKKAMEMIPKMKFSSGGMAKKGYAAGGMAMVEKDGKKVPAFAADGKGKMAHGGAVKAVVKKKK